MRIIAVAVALVMTLAASASTQENEPMPKDTSNPRQAFYMSAADLAAVAAKEVACCSFFTFIVSIDATAARVAIVAPPDGVPLVRELFGAVDQPVAATRVSAANEQ